VAVTPAENDALSADEVRLLANLAVEYIDAPDDPLEPHPAWKAICELHKRGGRAALDLASAWRKVSPEQRRVAACILGQLGYADGSFAEERFSLLAEMLASETSDAADPAVLNDICVAFGHLRDPRAIPLVLPLADHESENVRFGVVSALSTHDDADAIAGLIVLSRDVDADVRDWATFGLGSLTDADTPELREALMARLRDPDGDTDQEAIFGLASRGDLRVVPRIIEALEACELSSPLLEAVTVLALPDFCPALRAVPSDQLIFSVEAQQIDLTAYWREAVEACKCGSGRHDEGGRLIDGE
jgi:hypothetical protein